MGYSYNVNVRDLPFTDDHHDGFAGGGGASEGYEQATGRPVTAAYNHNPVALRMHRANHGQTRHYCEDIRRISPRTACRNRRPRSAHFSPDCRDFSKAKGGKPKSKRVRGLAWTMIHWMNAVAPGLVTWENVEEFEGWCPLLADGTRSPWRDGWFFTCLTGAMFRRGYQVQWRGKDGIVYRRTSAGAEPVFVRGRMLRWSGRAADFGAPTIRVRHFGMARCDGEPIVWPAPTHAPAVLRGLALERSAAECLDFGLPCPSIFLTKAAAKRAGLNVKRPIALASQKRIAKGVKRFVMDAADPFLALLTHEGNDGVESVRVPFKTITGANRGERALVAPVLAHTAHGERDLRGKKRGRGSRAVLEPLSSITGSNDLALVAPVLAYGQHRGRVRSVRRPAHTITASPKDTNQLVSVHLTKFTTGGVGSPADKPFPTITSNSYHKRPGGNPPLGVIATHVVKMRGHGAHSPGHDLREPMPTVSAGGTHLAQAACFLAQNNGGMVGHTLREPVSTIAGKGANQSLVAAHVAAYFGTDQAPDLRGPMHTVTTKDRFAYVESVLAAPPFTPEMEAGARRVAKFLRRHGIEFEGEFATVKVGGGVFVIVDIGLRMLTARELFRAQGFRESYIIGDDPAQGLKLTKTQQVHMCGNSVCPPIMAAIYRANLPDLCGQRRAA